MQSSGLAEPLVIDLSDDEESDPDLGLYSPGRSDVNPEVRVGSIVYCIGPFYVLFNHYCFCILLILLQEAEPISPAVLGRDGSPGRPYNSSQPEGTTLSGPDPEVMPSSSATGQREAKTSRLDSAVGLQDRAN